MVFRKTADGYVVRLEKSDIFFETMMPFLMEENITSAFFYGLGGAEWAELGLYDLNDKQYHFKYFGGPLEITNITGNIAKSGDEFKIHAHATIAGPDMVASAGHVKAMGIAGTCELYIRNIDFQMERSLDDDIGLELLDL